MANRVDDDGPVAVGSALFSAIKRRKLPLMLWVVVCLIATVLYVHSIQPTFTATATIILENRAVLANGVEKSSSPAPVLDNAQTESQLEVIRSERLLRTVFDGLKLSTSPEFQPSPPSYIAVLRNTIADLFSSPDSQERGDIASAVAFQNFSGRLFVRRVGQSYVVEIAYSSADPTQARRIANSIVSAYLAQSIVFKADAAQNGAEFLQGRLNSLNSQAKASVEAVAAGRLPLTPTPDADARVISAALQPLSKSAPRTGLIVAFGGTMALMTGLLLIAIVNALDRRIHTPQDLIRITGLPCLGVIPDLGKRFSRRRLSRADMASVTQADPDSMFAVAIRDLRTSVMLAFPSSENFRTGKTIALVAWSSESSCSLICSNLATVVSGPRHICTLIDADIGFGGKSHVDRTDAPISCGLADVLKDRARIEALEIFEIGFVRFVAPISHSAESTRDAFIGGVEMAAVLGVFAKNGDVFLDLPPLSRAGDSRAAAALADAVILVVAAGRTDREQVAKAVSMLSSSGANLIGVVLSQSKMDS